MRMTGKRVIVTAGASGMGRAGATLMAREGATVAIVDIAKDRAQQVVDEITAAGGRAHAFAADLSVAAECQRVIDEAAAWMGGLDGLWSHAGIPGPAAIEGLDLDAYRLAVDLNLTSAILCAGAAAPHMRKAGKGAILFTSSIGGLVGSPHAPVYSAAKFGIVGLTMSLGLRYAPENIRVNAVCPGPIDTPMLPSFFARSDDKKDHDENFKKLMAAVPMGRLGKPEEIGHAAMWLLSDDASYVTGVALPVDGGYVAR